MPDCREVLLSRYAELPPPGSPDRGDALKRFCRRWESRVRGLYRHDKGGLYMAQDLAIIEGDLSLAVTYSAADGSLWIRPVENFLGEIRLGVPRFKLARPKR